MTFLIRHLVFRSGPQAHRASSSINIRMQDEPISSGQGNRPRRRRRHHGQTPPSDQPQSTVQQILHPGNLLRRLLPSSSLFKSDSQAPWAKSSKTRNCWVKQKKVKYCTWEGERLGNAMHAGIVGVKKTCNEVLIKKPHTQKSLPGKLCSEPAVQARPVLLWIAYQEIHTKNDEVPTSACNYDTERNFQATSYKKPNSLWQATEAFWQITCTVVCFR